MYEPHTMPKLFLKMFMVTAVIGLLIFSIGLFRNMGNEQAAFAVGYSFFWLIFTYVTVTMKVKINYTLSMIVTTLWIIATVAEIAILFSL